METISKKILVVIPAYNEELTIASVIEGFYHYLPEGLICVVNNNSTDATGEVAKKKLQELGILNTKGIVLEEYKQGKANAIKRAFSQIDAEIYVMIDADCTYDISQIRELIKPVAEGKADMVIGDRHSNGHYKMENKRMFHGFGNNLVKGIINILYRSQLKDILSGYRVFNEDFVKNYPIVTSGFELETEITLFALENNYLIKEIPTKYIDRPEHSKSKLNTYSDGIKVLIALFTIFKNYKPFIFFGTFSILCLLMSLGIGIPVIFDFFKTGLVERFPSAFLAMGLFLLSIIFLTVALILDTIVSIERKNIELRKSQNVKKLLFQ